MPIEEAMLLLKNFNLASEKPPEGKADSPQDTTPEDTEPKKDGLSLKGPTPASKAGGGFKLSIPGSFALLLGLILLLVFAISPAYKGTSKSRLDILLGVILRGGSMRQEPTSAVQPLAALSGNGQGGGDTYHLNLPGSGAWYTASEVGLYAGY